MATFDATASRRRQLARCRGTNVHAVLEESPPLDVRPAIGGSAMLCLSATDLTPLVDLAKRYLRHFDEHPQLAWHDVCFTAAAGRAILGQRLAVCAATLSEARKLLQQWLAEPRPNMVLAKAQLS